MTRKKPPSVSIVRSSPAEDLTFVAAAGGQSQSVEMRYEDENRIFADRELVEQAVIKHCLTTAAPFLESALSIVGLSRQERVHERGW